MSAPEKPSRVQKVPREPDNLLVARAGRGARGRWEWMGSDGATVGAAGSAGVGRVARTGRSGDRGQRVGLAPRLVEGLGEQGRRLGAGYGVLVVEDEERDAGDADGLRLPDVGTHRVEVGAGLEGVANLVGVQPSSDADR